MRRPLACAFAVLCAASCKGPAFAWSTFEAGDESWILSGDPTSTHPDDLPTGGNPGGNLCGTDGESFDIWSFDAPLNYLGNAERAYGKKVTWDLKQLQLRNPVRGRELVIQGGGLSAFWNAKELPGLAWTSFSARLDDSSGWNLDMEGGPASEADLRLILRNLTAVRFRGEFVDGPDRACLDNVFFGREE
jgi:hypothetical protein